VIILCLRKTDPYDPVAGSELEYCDKCHTEIWVSPSTPREAVRRCLTCGLADIEPDDILELLPGQREEIVAELRRQVRRPKK
jgi:hypothetical protein